jgi:hypothetical protein
MPGTSRAKTRFALLAGQDENIDACSPGGAKRNPGLITQSPSFRARVSASPESILPIMVMDSGSALRAALRCASAHRGMTRDEIRRLGDEFVRRRN